MSASAITPATIPFVSGGVLAGGRLVVIPNDLAGDNWSGYLDNSGSFNVKVEPLGFLA